MASRIEITRLGLDAGGLRREAARAEDAAAARRMLALALILEGRSRTEAAESCAMERQTLRDWVHRYNEEGLLGLADRKPSGRPPRLHQAQKVEIAALVEKGPDPDKDGIVRWRCVDLQRIILDRFGVEMAERTIGKLLKALGFRKISARPAHPQGDQDARTAFKKTSPIWSRTPSQTKRNPSQLKSGFKTKPEWDSKAR